MASSMLTAEATALASAEDNVNEALNTKMHSCANDPDFAVICDFLQKFSKDLGLDLPNFKQLLDWLTKTDEVSPQLKEMQIKLLRKTRKTVHEKSWESALSKFCFTYSAHDAWEIERFGYKNASPKIKLRILRELFECQFERNNKFRAKILTLSADSLRSQPIGRDRLGHAYWVTQDNDCNLRIYQEHLDEDIWQVVATNREEFVNLIKSLRGSEVVLPSADIGIVDEDTCSSSSHSCSETPQKSPIPNNNLQEDKQKVPKLSIKINQRHLKDVGKNDVGKGEEELAAEEDSKIILRALNCSATECDDEEFEEAEEEYEDESDDDIVEEDDEEKFTNLELNGIKKVKPLLISQSKIVNLAKCDTKVDVIAAKKRTLEQVGGNSPIQNDNEQTNLIKKSRPSLLDSKRSNKFSKYRGSNECGEEDYEETAEEDDNVDEEMEEEDIDSVAAEEDENEEKLFEDFEDEDEVGEEKSESVLHVLGEGSGEECEVGNSFLNYELNDSETIVSNVIEEAIFYIHGEGYGKECLVGNKKNESDAPKTIKLTADSLENSSLKTREDKSKLFFGQPGCLQLDATTKNDSKDFGIIKFSEKLEHKNTEVSEKNILEETKNTYKTQLDTNDESNEINGENSHKNFKNQKLIEMFSEPSNTDISHSKNLDNTNLQNWENDKKKSKSENSSTLKPTSCSTTEQTHVNKMSVLESLKKELRESKQKSIEKSISSTGESNNTTLPSSVIINRKRRIDNLTAQQNTSMRNSNSESEIDLNSEIQEDIPNEPKLDTDELDVGGKRLKMRAKQTNSELRKKIEAQKVAAKEENTSSSGGEEESRRTKKVIIIKKHADQKFMIEGTGKNLESPKHARLSLKTEEKEAMCTDATISLNILGKNKPALTEVNENMVKKNPEEDETESVSASAVETSNVRSHRIPITKPLKKNFVRKDESDEDPLVTKRTPSDNLISSESTVSKVPEDKETLHINSAKSPQNSPETKKKSIKNVAPKNDVNCEHNKERVTEEETKILVKEEICGIKKEDYGKDECASEFLPPVAGRRSGRRGGLLTTPIVENFQPKKTRGFTKNYNKMPIQNVANCDEDIKGIKGENIVLPTDKLAFEVKEKNEEEKDANNDYVKTTNVTELSKNQFTKSITSPIKGFRKQRDVDATNIIEVTDNETPVRQSRRIAQQKIREEAERRKLEEIALRTMKQELKKKKKAEKQVDHLVVPPTEASSESEESDVETTKKVQKKKCPGKNGSWSSGSEEQEEPDEEDEDPPHYEIDAGSPLFKSDHEFSPESDIEDESQVVPMKRARTARKEDAADDAPDEEEACQKCNKSDHPEWILLCDYCDKGYHCSCLSPVLFYIPEGDWYCPPCQQEQLIKALESHLKEFDDLVEHKRHEEKEKILAEEEKARQEKEINNKHKNQEKKTKVNNDSSDNDVSPSSQEDGYSDESVNSVRRKSFAHKKTNRFKNLKIKDKRNHRDRRKNARYVRNRSHNHGSDSDSDSRFNSKRMSKSNSTSTSSSSYSESDNEPIYKLRKRRQINVSYRLNEYDDLINSALKKEMDEAAGAGNLGRGKDISTIIEADKEEKARQKQLDDEQPANAELYKSKTEEDSCKKINENPVEINLKQPEEKRESIDDDSDDEPIKHKFNIKPSLKKKSRKLTTLDISSEDDDGSDEDFKGSSLDDDDEEDTSISASNSDSSLDIYKRRGMSRKKRRKAARRAFRERRKDRNFVVDESDDEEVQRPKSKKKRKDDSDYTESEADDDDDNSELSENIDSADLCDDTTSDESDGAWRPNKSKKAKKSSTCFAQKFPKPKKLEIKKTKKIEYSDDDVSETDEDENDEESCGGGGGGKEMGGKQPRSQPLKTSNTATKLKGKGGTSTKIKKKKKSSEDELSELDSEDSTRRTRGRRYAYMEDFDDESSDGGIKPGVQRPDTPPEEREKFIKRQEEIKRMLAEKNAEGAKLVATPRLTPIKTDSEKEKRSPLKSSGDSLSTVPLSVIRQAKVLDIDYLQRRGEHLDDLSTDVGEVDDFDDADLPDDLPEDMDEDTIARMVEEEEEFGAAAARELPTPDEVLRAPLSIKPKIKDVEKSILCSNASPFPSNAPQTPVTLPPSSGLQEPIRKRLPMPTMHPPLLRHQFLLHDSIASAQHLMQRHSGHPTTSHLLQSALSAPLTQPLERNYPSTSTSQSHHSLINRMTHSIPLQPTATHMIGTVRPPISNSSKSTALIDHLEQEKSNNTRTETEMKPRGRRKKITPLRDTLQKQQAAAAVTAATATNSIMALASANTKESVIASVHPNVIKSVPPTKGHMETSVITSVSPSMPPVSSRSAITRPSVSGIYSRSDGPRFYESMGNRPGVLRHRGPPQIPHSLLQPHPAIRSSYGPPPPLKGSNSVAANLPTSSTPGSIRPSVHHVPPFVGLSPNARHSSPQLNMYRQPIYGNPSFGARVNLRPNMHASEYSTGSRTYSPYGFYPPPPPLTTPGQGPTSSLMPKIHQPISQPSTSVIVSATAAASSKSAIMPTGPSSVLCEHSSKSSTITPVLSIKVGPSKSPSHSPQSSKVVIEPRKNLTTLQSYNAISPAKKSPLPAAGESSRSLHSPGIQPEVMDDLSSTPGLPDNSLKNEPTPVEGHASEFSGLVSYFSSQHDDYNT